MITILRITHPLHYLYLNLHLILIFNIVYQYTMKIHFDLNFTLHIFNYIIFIIPVLLIITVLINSIQLFIKSNLSLVLFKLKSTKFTLYK
jgi:hypothetical protein